MALGLGGAVLATAQTSPPPEQTPDGDQIVVTGMRNVVENGRARPCRRLRGDPLDLVDVTPPTGGPIGVLRRSAIVPVGNGKFAFGPNMEQVTGPVFWQRAGSAIEQYNFRAPKDESPMCIGAKAPDAKGFAQFLRITDAAPFRGKRVRFTAWAATGSAGLVRFWLAAGGDRRLENGGNTNNQPWGGDHGWTPVLLEMGPVAKNAAHVSYGFLLSGKGSVWVYKPRLEIVADEPGGSRTGDVAVIGTGKH